MEVNGIPVRQHETAAAMIKASQGRTLRLGVLCMANQQGRAGGSIKEFHQGGDGLRQDRKHKAIEFNKKVSLDLVCCAQGWPWASDKNPMGLMSSGSIHINNLGRAYRRYSPTNIFTPIPNTSRWLLIHITFMLLVWMLTNILVFFSISIFLVNITQIGLCGENVDAEFAATCGLRSALVHVTDWAGPGRRSWGEE